jgi:5-methylcytosine-specific restriction endonuclease McrA
MNTRIKQGQHLSPSTEFKKGQTSWNKGIKGILKANSGSFKKGMVAHNKTEWITKICACGKEFSNPPSWAYKKSCSRACSNLARKGKTSPMKGKHHTPEAKAKLRAAHLGRRGEAHWNYKGYNGRTERKIAMAQDEYVQWRKAIFTKDDYTCQGCSVRGGYLEADHIQPWALFPELRYNVDNGRTLCRPCHLLTPTWGGKTKVLEKVG